jgi:hypothetical protein
MSANALHEESGSARTPGIKGSGSESTQLTPLMPYGEESGSARTPGERRSGSALA